MLAAAGRRIVPLPAGATHPRIVRTAALVGNISTLGVASGEHWSAVHCGGGWARVVPHMFACPILMVMKGLELRKSKTKVDFSVEWQRVGPKKTGDIDAIRKGKRPSKDVGNFEGEGNVGDAGDPPRAQRSELLGRSAR